MAFSSIFAIYFLFFAFGAFLLLPFGVRTDEEAGTPKVAGQADSAPANFRPGLVILRTTILSLVICGLLMLNYKQGWITAKDIDVFGEPAGFSSGVG